MNLLHLTPSLRETSSPYSQFAIGLKDNFDQTIGSLEKNKIKINEKIKLFHGESSALKMFIQTKKNISKNQYDLIHLHNGTTGIIFLFTLFPFNFNLLKKTIFTIHNSWNNFTIRNKLLIFIVMLSVSNSCACSSSVYESLPKIIKYLIGKKLKIINNGFNNEKIDIVEKKKLNNLHFDETSKIKIVYVGMLNDIKNQIALLEVLNLIKFEAEIIFLGEGANKKKLIEFSKKISSSIQIKFKGLVSRDLTYEHMLEADAYISLSKGEGLPIAGLEAMYAGCFMILSTIPPHKELSPPPERCFFVDISNKEEIVNSLYYLSKNIEKIKDEREISKEYSKNNFSAKKMLEGYKKVYDSLK